MADLSHMRVLVVDDVETNVDILVETLGDDYRVSVAMDGESALELAQQRPPDLILMDVMMPGLDGYEVCRRLKSNMATADIPVIFLTALTDEENEARGLELGAVDYIAKPFSAGLVRTRVKNYLELKRYKDNLPPLFETRAGEAGTGQDLSPEHIGTLAEFRDLKAMGHARRVGHYIRCLGGHLKNHPAFREQLDEKVIDLMGRAAPLHDIGMMTVPDSILKKPGKLTPDEFEIVKIHTVCGFNVLNAGRSRPGMASFSECAANIAYTHHERWDGAGYPRGLSGLAIPVAGRLMAVADVYDALVSRRVYRKPCTHSEAVDMIREGRGTRFDPDIVDGFSSVKGDFRMIALKFADYDEEREALGR